MTSRIQALTTGFVDRHLLPVSQSYTHNQITKVKTDPKIKEDGECSRGSYSWRKSSPKLTFGCRSDIKDIQARLCWRGDIIVRDFGDCLLL